MSFGVCSLHVLGHHISMVHEVADPRVWHRVGWCLDPFLQSAELDPVLASLRNEICIKQMYLVPFCHETSGSEGVIEEVGEEP
jgi:hypothetical protein